MRSRWMLLAMAVAACDEGGSYTDAQARGAMGGRSDANPLHHDRYTDGECLSAVSGAGYAPGPHFSGSYADLTGRPDLGRLEGEVGGATFSDGCIDKSPNPPDCSTCLSGTCLAGGSGYPTTGWAWLATVTPPSEGVLDLVVGPLLICDGDRIPLPAQVRLEVRLQERSGFPLPDDGANVLAGSAAVTFEPGGGWTTPAADAPLHARIATTTDDDPAGGTGIFRPGSSFALFVKAVLPAGASPGVCAFRRANVVLHFTPLLTNTAITPG